MDCRKPRSSSRHCFIFEEGEISDIEDEDRTEKEVEQQRKDNFIREWSEKQSQKTVISEAEMDVDSEGEEKGCTIDTKPVAMTITFHDEKFAKSNRGVIETQMVLKFGHVMVDSNDLCIFVLHEEKTEELVKTIAAPLGVMSIVFHDDAFCREYSKFMLNLCKTMFGSSKTTSHEPWLIEVMQNDFLNFEVDTTPFGRDGLPIYNKNELGKLVDKEETTKESSRKGGVCFNCMGCHSLRDCTRPKNYTVINENRKKFMENKAKQPGRYHAEIDRYSEFAPGQISDDLRCALGLSATQLPLHVYRMRKYGYPPGWLLEAKIAHSGVTVYGKNGIVFEEGDEDGEIVDEGKDLYDIKKLVTFPGFNAPLPEGIVDEPEKCNCPPFSEDQSLEKLKESLAPNAMKSYVRRKRKFEDSSSESGDNDNDPISPAGPSNESVTSNDAINSPTVALPATPKVSAIKPVQVNLGTPILSSYSPFNKLPDRDKFATAVSDVINYENLPDSTGTYEKMVGSIARIREYREKENN